MRTFIIALCLAASPLFAHEGLHEQITEVTQRISAEPANAALYLKRGELYRLHEQFDLAAVDYDRAAQLDPNLHAVDRGRGLMLSAAGRAADATAVLRRYVSNVPSDAEGRVAFARALVKEGRPGDAAVEFSTALQQLPDPDIAIERAAALVGAGKRDEAVRSLDDMLSRLGPIVTLELAAIDLEVKSGNVECALRRIDAAMASASRKESWLERRGDILMSAGRVDEARDAYQAALDAIATLPAERRATRAISDLEERLRRQTANGKRP